MRLMETEASRKADNGNGNGHTNSRPPTPIRPGISVEPGPGSGTYLRAAEAAALLHVSPKTVSRWAKEGKIPHFVTLGGHRRFPKVEIERIAAGLEDVRDS